VPDDPTCPTHNTRFTRAPGDESTPDGSEDVSKLTYARVPPPTDKNGEEPKFKSGNALFTWASAATGNSSAHDTAGKLNVAAKSSILSRFNI
jgi:hypothetical protein